MCNCYQKSTKIGFKFFREIVQQSFWFYISLDPLDFVEDKFTPTIPSQNKNSEMSLNNSNGGGDDFKYSTIYTRIGFYKGRICAIKKFPSSFVDITRSIKKGLKCIKDLRHDNLNPFIG